MRAAKVQRFVRIRTVNDVAQFAINFKVQDLERLKMQSNPVSSPSKITTNSRERAVINRYGTIETRGREFTPMTYIWSLGTLSDKNC